MSVVYKVYSNDGAGGPVNYSTPLATVSGLSWASPPIPTGSDITYAVRASDSASGLEERNTDAAVRIVTDSSGIDRTGRPRSPVGLGVRATAGGTARVEWTQPPAGTARPPTSFRVWTIAAPGPIDYTATPVTIPYRGNPQHSATLAGLADGVAYLVAVRAVNAAGDDGNTTVATVVGSTTGPLPVGSLAATLS